MSYLGIRGFEQLLKDGVASPGAVLLRAPAIPEREQVCAQFLAEGLRKGERSVLIAPESVSRRIEAAVGRLGLDVPRARESGVLAVVPLAATFAAEGADEFVPVDRADAIVRERLRAPSDGPRRLVVDVLPRPRTEDELDAAYAFVNGLVAELRESDSLSLVVVPRDGDFSAEATEAFDAVLDLRPLEPSGVGLAVVALAGTPFPRAPLNLEEFEGELVLVDARRVDTTAVEVPCPICGTNIPPGATECPNCKAPRPAVSRQRGILEYLESLRTQVGIAQEARRPLVRRPKEPPVRERTVETPSARGLTNGLARAGAPGMVNGLGRTNGLVNGLASARRGLTNGLTNGSGFTNGLGSRKYRLETRRRLWKLHMIPLVAVALVLAPLFLPPPAAPVETFGVDGDFSDWAARVPMSADASLPGSIDVTGAEVRATGERLSGFVETRSPLFTGSPDGLVTDSVRVFVDADGDATTGYRLEGLGAELLVQIQGVAGSVTSRRVLRFTQAGDRDDWNGWEPSETLLVALGRGGEANRLEFSFVVPGTLDATRSRVLLHTVAWNGARDRSEVALSPVGPLLAIDETSVAPDAFAGSTAPLLELRVRAPQGPATLASVRLVAGGTLPAAALRSVRLLDESSTELATDSNPGDGIELDLGTSLAVEGEVRTLRVELEVDPDANGTVGLAVAGDGGIDAPGAATFLRTLPADRDRAYVGGVPPGAVVDGAFGEWPLPLADPVNEPSTDGNANVDLTAFDSTRSGTAVAVYARVAGRLLGGADAPARSPSIPQVSPRDSDRDGVPDEVEAAISPTAPFDFNNDGIADADSGNDRDGDGVLDFPDGPDLWLNTTIPDSYPEPYAGRTVSVFIGVVQAPAVRGEDTLRVFIDADADPGTGYATAVGADWMVEVVGRLGTTRTQGLFRFAGASPGAWSWTRVDDVDLALGSRQIELIASLPVPPVPGTQVFIDLSDWKRGFDTSEVATRGITRSSEGAWLQADRYGVQLPDTADGPDGFLVQTPEVSMAWHLAAILVEDPQGATTLPLTSEGPDATESTASYALRIGSSPATLRYAFGPASIKEEIVLAAPPADLAAADRLRIRFSLDLSDGAAVVPLVGPPGTRSPVEPGDYAILVDGGVVARLPRPFLEDADGRTTPCGYASPSPDSLEVECPADALRDARYPIAIDPSTEFTLSNDGPHGQAGEFLGWSIAAGDFNGDGYVDVLAGAPYNDKNATDAGFAYLFLGPFSADGPTPDVALVGNKTSLYRAGQGVGAGDFDNDGIDDVVIGQQNGGPTLLFYGRDPWPAYVDTADVTFPAPAATGTDTFGRTIAAGNFDASGGADLVIGRPFYPDVTNPHGRAYVYFPPFSAYEDTPDLTLVPLNDTKGRFGSSLAVGRIDSDTKDDLVVGEIGVTVGTSTYGRISFFKGSSLTGSGDVSPDATTIHLTSGAQFGASVAVGTLNGDSYADVLVGAPAASGNNGAAYAFFAKSDGSGMDDNQSIDLTFSSQSSGEKFGSAVLIADYLNDGANDAIIGAEAYTSSRGRVYVFDDPVTDPSTPDETLTGAASDDERFGRALSGGKRSNDPIYVLMITGPYWDDVGETSAGRVVIATIPEFPDLALVVGLAMLLGLLVRRRRRHHRR